MNNQLTQKFFYTFSENYFCSTSENYISLKLLDFPFCGEWKIGEERLISF